MKDISQEKIFRMVGLRDGAHLMRQINAIQLSLEEQDGQMVAYWTEIQKDERQISLIAGRVSANETSIGQLQVTAQSLTASVSSLTTTVSGHTTKITSLELTDQSLTASVSSLNTTVGTHTTKIASLELTDQSLTASVSSLNTTVGTHTTKIASLELTDTSISNRVTAIEGDYVKEAEISLMVKKDSSGYISNASIKADRIDFTFTQSTNFVSNGTTVMNINSSGDLWILGDLKGGNIQGNYTIGSLGTKMEIYVDETIGATKCSGIRAHDSNNWEVIKLGMQEVNGNVTPSLRLNVQSTDQVYLYPNRIDFNHTIGNVTPVFSIGWYSNKLLIASPIDTWPSLSDVNVGQVYLDNGYLKVRTS